MVEDDCLNYTCPYVIDNALPNDVYQLKTMAGKKLKQKQNGRNLKKFLECQKIKQTKVMVMKWKLRTASNRIEK